MRTSALTFLRAHLATTRYGVLSCRGGTQGGQLPPVKAPETSSKPHVSHGSGENLFFLATMKTFTVICNV